MVLVVEGRSHEHGAHLGSYPKAPSIYIPTLGPKVYK